MTEDHFHWCPPGHRIEDMEDPDAIVFTPAAGELDPATLKERIHLLFSSHDTGHVFTWTPVQEDSVRAFNRADASDAREMNVDSWRSLWSQRAEREDFDSDWNRIREGEELDWIDSVLVGSFHREDYV